MLNILYYQIIWCKQVYHYLNFKYGGEEISAVASPTQLTHTVVYDVSFQGEVIAIEAQPGESDHIIWVKHLSGETNELIQAIGEAIERAEI